MYMAVPITFTSRITKVVVYHNLLVVGRLECLHLLLFGWQLMLELSHLFHHLQTQTVWEWKTRDDVQYYTVMQNSWWYNRSVHLSNYTGNYGSIQILMHTSLASYPDLSNISREKSTRFCMKNIEKQAAIRSVHMHGSVCIILWWPMLGYMPQTKDWRRLRCQDLWLYEVSVHYIHVPVP